MTPSGTKPKPIATLPRFDPAPSTRFAIDALAGAGVQGALIGRLAVWAHVPDPSEHAFTKDLDVALAPADLAKVCGWLAAQGHTMRALPIGGVNVEAPGGVNVDFITRAGELGDFSALFTAAVREAVEGGALAGSADGALPLVGVEHLVAMKLGTGEAKDLDDARRIMQAQAVDVPRLRALITSTLGPGTAARLEVFLRDIGHPAAHLRRDYKA